MKIEAAKLKEKEPRIIGWMIGFFVLWEIIRMLNIQQNARITFCVDVMEIILLGRIFPYIKINRHRWYLLFAGAVVVIFLTSAIRPSVVLHQTAPMLQRSLLPYVLAPAVGLLLSEKPLKTLVKIFTAAWTLFFAAITTAGIYCAVTGIHIVEPRWLWFIRVNGVALQLMDHENISGMNIAFSIAVAAAGFAVFDKKGVKALFLIGMLPMLFAIPLTRSRTGYVGAGVAVGLGVACALQRPLAKVLKHNWLRVAISVVLVIVLTAGMIPCIEWNRTTVNSYITGETGGLLISNAKADALSISQGAAYTIPEKVFWPSSRVFSGREDGWDAAIRLLREKPYLLIMGTSVPLVMEYINQIMPTDLDHLHCMPLQILVETGILGFALLILFLYFFFRAAGKLFFSADTSLWKRAAVIPCGSIMVMELVECNTRVARIRPAVVILMFFAGMVFLFAEQVKNKKRTASCEEHEAQE